MANNVKVSCLSASPCSIEADTDLQEAVEIVIRHLERQLRQVLPDRPDLIVLPECCDRPYMNGGPEDRLVAFYRQRRDQVRDSLAHIAKEHRCYIAYSAYREAAPGSWRNSTQLIGRSGETVGIYNKNHVVVEERMQSGVLYGKGAPVFETDFGRVACLICFDLNFDELRMQFVKQKPDLLIFSSAYHGGLMQNYWAYSCRTYFVGSVYPPNPNAIVSPVGEVIAESTNYYPFITETINLDCAVFHIDYNNAKFGAIKQKYGSKVRIHDPGRLGCVLLSIETDEFAVRDIIDEFKLELLDDYFERALSHRCAPGNIEP